MKENEILRNELLSILWYGEKRAYAINCVKKAFHDIREEKFKTGANTTDKKHNVFKFFEKAIKTYCKGGMYKKYSNIFDCGNCEYMFTNNHFMLLQTYGTAFYNDVTDEAREYSSIIKPVPETFQKVKKEILESYNEKDFRKYQINYYDVCLYRDIYGFSDCSDTLDKDSIHYFHCGGRAYNIDYIIFCFLFFCAEKINIFVRKSDGMAILADTKKHDRYAIITPLRGV